MLIKLMKYEMVAMGRILLPAYLVILLFSISVNLGGQILSHTGSETIAIMVALASVGFSLGCVAVSILCVSLIVKRFYSNLLTDEGYVMMTLPVSVHHHVLNKLIVALIWFSITLAVVSLTIFISLFDINYPAEFLMIYEILGESMQEEFHAMGIHPTFFLFQLIFLSLLGFLSSCLQIYGAMAIGQRFSGSKIGWSVGVYIVWNISLQIIQTIFFTTLNLSGYSDYWFSTQNSAKFINDWILFGALSSLAHCVIAYCITTYFLKKRLNLP